MSVGECRMCGRLTGVDREGFCGCDTTVDVKVPSCEACGRMPWGCECEPGPTFGGRVVERREP